jgi:oxalate decarboxylase/phosphoglucose isomerase-like protein (cupin superfamily)
MSQLREQFLPVDLSSFADHRGRLATIDLSSEVPFVVRRVFWIFDVPVGTSRGGHAHKACSQFVVCGSGGAVLTISNSGVQTTVRLKAGSGILIPPMTFLEIVFEQECSLVLVFCDKPYDSGDYIYDQAACQ